MLVDCITLYFCQLFWLRHEICVLYRKIKYPQQFLQIITQLPVPYIRFHFELTPAVKEY